MVHAFKSSSHDGSPKADGRSSQACLRPFSCNACAMAIQTEHIPFSQSRCQSSKVITGGMGWNICRRRSFLAVLQVITSQNIRYGEFTVSSRPSCNQEYVVRNWFWMSLSRPIIHARLSCSDRVTKVPSSLSRNRPWWFQRHHCNTTNSMPREGVPASWDRGRDL